MKYEGSGEASIHNFSNNEKQLKSRKIWEKTKVKGFAKSEYAAKL